MTKKPSWSSSPSAWSRLHLEVAIKRTSLTLEDIVRAAMHLVDTQGVDALTMRRLASLLSVTAGALYPYIESKEVLFGYLIDEAIGEINLASFEGLTWQQIIRQAAVEMRRVFASHRDLVRLTFARIPTGSNSARLLEAILTQLKNGGLDDFYSLYVGDLLGQYVGVNVYEEYLRTHPDRGQPYDGGVSAFTNYLNGLDPSKFPTVTKVMRSQMQNLDFDRFAMGLEVIVNGIEYLTRNVKQRG